MILFSDEKQKFDASFNLATSCSWFFKAPDICMVRNAIYIYINMQIKFFITKNVIRAIIVT